MTTKGCLFNFSEQENVVSVKREGILKLLSSLVTNLQLNYLHSETDSCEETNKK